MALHSGTDRFSPLMSTLHHHHHHRLRGVESKDGLMYLLLDPCPRHLFLLGPSRPVQGPFLRDGSFKRMKDCDLAHILVRENIEVRRLACAAPPPTQEAMPLASVRTGSSQPNLQVPTTNATSTVPSLYSSSSSSNKELKQMGLPISFGAKKSGLGSERLIGPEYGLKCSNEDFTNPFFLNFFGLAET
ncbi:uncharacterized protein LOC133715915 [Rosa rugosa]|uniref:uncharacterized protein LOC133715915 n=1 Tax=Rosa rugosa TaxID=74645 RepID=UPI002B411F45|nr:uncharacterized protein LOC133715915 [Rosa rugosa]XP_061998596.1 uncharacterized protein LOC133715915 [Rosa rugosa]